MSGGETTRPMDPRSQSAFWSEVVRFASRYARSLNWPGVDAESVAQETALRLWRRMGEQGFRLDDDGEPPRALIATIARNGAVDEARRRATRTKREHAAGLDAARAVGTRATSPERIIEDREELHEVGLQFRDWRAFVERHRGPESRVLCGLLLEGTATYDEIVAAVRAEFPDTTLTSAGLRQAVARWNRSFPHLFKHLRRRKTSGSRNETKRGG